MRQLTSCRGSVCCRSLKTFREEIVSRRTLQARPPHSSSTARLRPTKLQTLSTLPSSEYLHFIYVSYNFLHVIPPFFEGIVPPVVVEAVVVHSRQRCQNRKTRRPLARPQLPHLSSIAPFDLFTCHLTSNRPHHRLRCLKTPPSPRYASAPAPQCIYPHIFFKYPRCIVLTCHSPLQQKKAAVEKKGGKKGKDGPKRALSAYMFFSQDWRERIKAENPDAGFGLSRSLLVVPITDHVVQVKLASS